MKRLAMTLAALALTVGCNNDDQPKPQLEFVHQTFIDGNRDGKYEKVKDYVCLGDSCIESAWDLSEEFSREQLEESFGDKKIYFTSGGRQ